jgi:signal transduction histidine kinase
VSGAAMRDSVSGRVQRRETAMLLLVLVSFHLGLLQEPAGWLGKAVSLVHFGVVLLWQPVVSAQRRLSWREMAAIVALVLVAGLMLSWGAALVWALMLAGVLGGRLFTYARPRARIPYWLALVALVIDLVGLIVPALLQLAGHPGEPGLNALATWLIFPLLALILIFPVLAEAREEATALDLVGSLLIVLALTGVILGALALMFLQKMAYLEALLTGLALIAGGLLVLAWFWGQHGNFAGLGLEVSRRMLSGGVHRMPLDRWLAHVNELAHEQIHPEQFLQRGAEHLLAWSDVVGLQWQPLPDAFVSGTGQCGVVSATDYDFSLRGLQVKLYARKTLANAALWQLDLMLHILAEIHAGKQQARQLQSDSYLRAVYETGARVTHEVKNLLQSLHGLCFAALALNEREDPRAQQMLASQLPRIVERLEQAAARIRRPSDESMRMEPAPHWWVRQQERLGGRAFDWHAVGDPAACGPLPAALFDNVLDNLLENALGKRPGSGASLSVRVTLSADGGACTLDVADDGEPIPQARVESLFLAPQASDSGLGIGLYQASRLAESMAYRLTLAENRAGCVRFRLAPIAEPAPR